MTIFSEIRGLVYRVRALLFPQISNSDINNLTAEDIIDIAIKQMKHNLRDIADMYTYLFGVSPVVNLSVSDHQVPVLWADIDILASMHYTRDEFEQIALDIIFKNSLDTGGNKFDFYYIIHEDLFLHCSSNETLKFPTFVFLSKDIPPNSWSIGIENAIILSWTLTCPYITFQHSNFTIEWNELNDVESINVTVDVSGTKLSIFNMSDINSMEVNGNNELHVCTEVLEKYVDRLRRFKMTRPIVIAMNVLTYVCLCASELCLLFTLVTYLGFPELRTVPGINNMFLSLSLLLAQLALLLGDNIPVPSTLCTSVGLITHFLWLWHFSWSFLSSLHMFQVFTAKIPVPSLKGRNTLTAVVKLTTLSVLVPIAVVVAVIISSYMTSHTIGYGRQACYLNTAYLVGLSVVAPICLVSVCSLTFLGITVASIHKVNQFLSVQSLGMDQYKNCLLYVKLSSVTGVYWVVTIVAELINSDVLWIISILLNGLQGVAIFVSYMCNKRVYRLYLSKFLSQQTSSLQKTTMTSE
nr:adhesion G protein-coupled receptor E2-like [Biomphalaria glabrata]